ncbi:hypothetical protein [Laspinema olomoucense]|nr:MULTISPECIES: hypothetical protein [unclassified Laspinema]MCT7974863.1 hypothetical protein [Laspinema sp. D3d]MCT7997118.1 hypothetical protein [Laspinema sp. D3c]
MVLTTMAVAWEIIAVSVAPFVNPGSDEYLPGLQELLSSSDRELTVW